MWLSLAFWQFRVSLEKSKCSLASLTSRHENVRLFKHTSRERANVYFRMHFFSHTVKCNHRCKCFVFSDSCRFLWIARFNFGRSRDFWMRSWKNKKNSKNTSLSKGKVILKRTSLLIQQERGNSYTAREIDCSCWWRPTQLIFCTNVITEVWNLKVWIIFISINLDVFVVQPRLKFLVR